MTPRNVVASVSQRLKNLAKAQQVSAEYVLLKYAIERFLWRLSLSPHKERLVLKGAALFSVWMGPLYRMTRDTDFASRTSLDDAFFRQCFSEICEQPIPEDDGVRFDVTSISIADIRKEARYQGKRVILIARIGQARIPLHFDIGFGDTIVPAPEQQDYPVLLQEMPSPHLTIYPRYTVIAEKVEAIVALGMANSRIKDYADIWLLAHRFDFVFTTLDEALTQTFRRRAQPRPQQLPIGFTSRFSDDPQKKLLWAGFRTRTAHLDDALVPASFEGVVADLTSFLKPFFEPQTPPPTHWIAGQAWQ